MNDQKIDAAYKEALRFIERVNELGKARQAKDRPDTRDNPIQAGALRRASLDLTRALAAMRKSRSY